MDRQLSEMQTKQSLKQEAERIKQMDKIRDYQQKGSIAADKFKAETGIEEKIKRDEERYAKAVVEKQSAANIDDQMKLRKQKMVQ